MALLIVFGANVFGCPSFFFLQGLVTCLLASASLRSSNRLLVYLDDDMADGAAGFNRLGSSISTTFAVGFLDRLADSSSYRQCVVAWVPATCSGRRRREPGAVIVWLDNVQVRARAEIDRLLRA